VTVPTVALLIIAVTGLVKACTAAWRALRRWDDNDPPVRPMKPKPPKRPLDDDTWTR